MLAVPLKEGRPAHWSEALRNYVKREYPREVLEKHSTSIQLLSTTRDKLINSGNSHATNLKIMEDYLVMLGQVEPRFPISENKVAITFTWYDALRPTKKISMQAIALERAAVLFNYGATLSHQGMVQERSELTGLKKALNFFQRAAGVFNYLREEVLAKTLTGPVTTDLSSEALDMFESLMLAQAQACFYEKATMDRLKPHILSKLAARAAAWYDHALSCARSGILSQTLDKAWAAHLEFQSRGFSSSANLQLSRAVHLEAEETTRGYGEEIARLALASDLCVSAIQCARTNKLPGQMVETMEHLRKVINESLDEASNNNNSIYMEEIPNKHSLAAPSMAALAKPLPPGEELTSPAMLGIVSADSGPASVFSELLPVEMQQAEMVYQSRVSSLVETSGQRVMNAAEEIKLRLAEAGLPAAVEAGDGSSGLPEVVWERIQSSVTSRGGVDGLREGLNSNEQLAQKAEMELREIEDKINEEEGEDTRCRSTWGAQWPTKLSAELNMPMRADVQRYHKLIAEARASDQVLREKLSGSLDKMEILKFSRARLDQMLPSSENTAENPELESVRGELAVLLVELGTNVQATERMQAELVDDASGDSIGRAMSQAPGGVSAVAASEARTNALIERELEKYSSLLDAIQRKIREQPAMLSRVLDMNHEFSAMRSQSEATIKREGLIAEIDRGINAFEEIVMFIKEGEKFYVNLSTRIDQLATSTTDYCFVREIQRKDLEAQLAARNAGGGGGGGGASAASPPPAYPTSVNGGGGTGAYPGMQRPEYRREQSAPFMQPYAAGSATAPAAAYPFNSGASAAPAFPVQQSAPPPAAAAPPPAYQSAAAASPQVNQESLDMLRAMLGSEYSDAQLIQALSGADGDVNRAVNHLMSAQDAAVTSSPSSRNHGNRRSKKRYGLFK